MVSCFCFLWGLCFVLIVFTSWWGRCLLFCFVFYFLCHQEEKNVFVNPLTPFCFYFRKTHPLPLLSHLKFDLLCLPIFRSYDFLSFFFLRRCVFLSASFGVVVACSLSPEKCSLMRVSASEHSPELSTLPKCALGFRLLPPPAVEWPSSSCEKLSGRMRMVVCGWGKESPRERLDLVCYRAFLGGRRGDPS